MKRTQNPAVRSLAILNHLATEAFGADNQKQLIFHILNKTVGLCSYDRAVLWDMRNKKKPKVLGVSGQSSFDADAAIVKQWRLLLRDITDLGKEEVVAQAELKKEQGSLLWCPIIVGDKLVAGLWLERWGKVTWGDAERKLIKQLVGSYAAAWKVHTPKVVHSFFRRTRVAAALAIVLAASLFIKVPLRVVAPCEVVPSEPIMVSAPLDGIIEEVAVKPGEYVEAGTLLYRYDPRVPEQEFKVAQKQLEIIQAELHRATALSFSEPEALSKVATLQLQLQKEQLRLEQAKYKMERVNIYAPQAGVLVFDDPEQWRGKPVALGERVLLVSDPNQTKLRLWLPEDDNIALNKEKNVRVILNIAPHKHLEAQLDYIASYTAPDERGVVSFTGEATWTDEEQPPSLGLKGTALLYGEEVSLGYWIIRRPLATIRRAFGV